MQNFIVKSVYIDEQKHNLLIFLNKLKKYILYFQLWLEIINKHIRSEKLEVINYSNSVEKFRKGARLRLQNGAACKYK